MDLTREGIPKLVGHHLEGPPPIQLSSIVGSREFLHLKTAMPVQKYVLEDSPLGNLFQDCTGLDKRETEEYTVIAQEKFHSKFGFEEGFEGRLRYGLMNKRKEVLGNEYEYITKVIILFMTLRRCN